MNKYRAINGLIGSMLAYLLLWFLIPKAGFLHLLASHSYNTTAQGAAQIFAGAVHGLAVGLPMLLFMAIQIAAIYYFSMIQLRWWGYLLTMVGALVLVVGILSAIINIHAIPEHLQRYPNLREHIALLGGYYGPWRLPISVALIAAAASIGGLVSFRISDANLLLPVGMFAAAIDFWTVNYGFVNVAMSRTPDLVNAVSVPIPHAGTGMFIPNTMIGPGDFLFLALVFAAVFRLKLNAANNFWYIFGAMSVGMMAVMFDLLPFLPALTVLAVGIIAANYRSFKLSKQEKISIAVVAVVLAISVPVVRSLFIGDDPPPKQQQSVPEKAE